MVRLAIAFFLIQTGFHGYTAALPLALARAGRMDADIGLIVGIAALVQIPVALVVGPLIDRFGGVRLFVIGGLTYVAASAIMLLPGVDPATSTAEFVAARLLQGTGIAVVLPAALSVVPRLVEVARHGLALSLAGLSQNLTLVVIPPLSLVALDRFGLPGVAVFVLVVVAIAFALALARPLRFVVQSGGHVEALAPPKRLRLAWRGSWLAPLAIELLFALHWGLITAYLPQRAEAQGADIGLMFASSGLGIMLARVPAGWLADRFGPLRPILLGISITFAGLSLLLPTPTTPLLVVSGALTGAGAGLIVTPLLLALTRRSSDADRGTAFALFSGSFALALAIGSVGAAPVIEQVGFEPAVVATLVALIAAGLVALLDRSLRVTEVREPDLEHEVAAAPPVGP